MQTDYAIREKKIRTGFIAQDVEKTAQQIGYDFDGVNHPQNAKDNYSLVYADFVPSLAKAVQELSGQNDSLKNNNATLRSQLQKQQSQIDDLKTLVLSIQQKQDACSPSANAAAQTYNTIITDGAALEQNTPNPFNHSTSIGYTLPQKFNAAQIIITDKNGETLKAINISGTGKGRINVDASVLASGAYNYSLLVDGKLIGSKQMVLLR